MKRYNDNGERKLNLSQKQSENDWKVVAPKNRSQNRHYNANLNNKQTISVEVTNHLFIYDDIIKYKNTIKTFPASIFECNQTIKIITSKPTHEIVLNRQQHPVLKIMKDVPKMTSSILGSLNVISNDNVFDVANDITKINDICSQEGFSILANNIIKKVSNDVKFIDTYSILCKYLSQMRIDTKITFISVIAVKIKDIFDKYINFIPIVINDTTENEKEEFMMSNSNIIDDELNIDKNKMSNYVKFIGHLYMNNVLKEEAVTTCLTSFTQMIKNKTDKNGKICKNCDIELIVTLVNVVHNKYEKLGDVYNFLYSIMNSCLQNRDKFMIQDLLEPRKK